MIERLSMIVIEKLLHYYREADRDYDRETIRLLATIWKTEGIDLLFRPPNMIMYYGVYASL